MDPVDKKTLLDACRETLDWLSEFSSSASREDFEEQKGEIISSGLSDYKQIVQESRYRTRRVVIS